MRNRSGFTLLELLFVLAIMGILAGLAVPPFLALLPDHRLKSAVDELFANLQLAKTTAVRQATDCTVAFTGTGYTVQSEGATIRSVALADYGSGVTFAHPSGNPDRAFPDRIVFNSRGLTTINKYACLTNDKRTGYFQVGALWGGIKIKKWNGSTFE